MAIASESRVFTSTQICNTSDQDAIYDPVVPSDTFNFSNSNVTFNSHLTFTTSFDVEAMINLSAGSFITLITILGQLLVLVVAFKDPRLRTPSNMFIISLACADLFIGLISMPAWTMYSALGFWPLSQFLCDLWNAIDYVLCIISIYTILFISLDRYLSLRNPFTYAIRRTPTQAKAILVSIWIFTSIVYGTFVGVTQYIFGSVRIQNDCVMYYLNHPYVTISHVILAIWMPIIGTLVIYILIYRLATHAGNIEQQFKQASDTGVKGQQPSTVQSKNMSTAGRSNASHKSKDGEDKAVKTIALLLSIYVVCWLPMSFVFLIMSYRAIAVQWLVLVYWLGYINSMLNPFCYAIGNPYFRETMFKLFKREIKNHPLVTSHGNF